MDKILLLECKQFLHTKSDPVWSYHFTASFDCYWLKGSPVFRYMLTRKENKTQQINKIDWGRTALY